MKKRKLSVLLAFSLSAFVVLTGCKGGEKTAEQAAKPAETPKTTRLSEVDFERACGYISTGVQVVTAR